MTNEICQSNLFGSLIKLRSTDSSNSMIMYDSSLYAFYFISWLKADFHYTTDWTDRINLNFVFLLLLLYLRTLIRIDEFPNSTNYIYNPNNFETFCSGAGRQVRSEGSVAWAQVPPQEAAPGLGPGSCLPAPAGPGPPAPAPAAPRVTPRSPPGASRTSWGQWGTQGKDDLLKKCNGYFRVSALCQLELEMIGSTNRDFDVESSPLTPKRK